MLGELAGPDYSAVTVSRADGENGACLMVPRTRIERVTYPLGGGRSIH